MTAVIDESMIRAIAGRARSESNGHQVIAVASQPHWDGPDEVEADGGPVEVRPCPSVLAVRELLSELNPEEDRQVVILTPVSREELGLEVLARLWRQKIIRPLGWDAVQQLFRVHRMDPKLADHRWPVDLLVKVAPSRGYPPPPSGFLDVDRAWRELLRHGLRLEPASSSPEDLLRWGERDEARAALQGPVGGDREQVASWLERTVGPVAQHVIRLVGEGRGADLVPLGLVCDVLWDDGLEEESAVTTARVRFEGPLGARGLTGEEARSWAQAAVRLVWRAQKLSDDAARQRWVSRAESILSNDLGATELAYASDVLARAFEQRLARAGEALQRALEDGSPEALGRLHESVEWVASHLRAEDADGADRVARLRMAERLVRRVQWAEGQEDAADLPEAGRGFANEGAWVDRAWEAIRHGETAPALAEAYGEILERIDAIRLERDERFAAHLAEWSSVEPSGRKPLLPVEDVLDEILVPIARETPVLFLVLDGWSHPEALQLEEDLSRAGWVRQGPVKDGHPLVVSALPSVTSVSRTSLLSGTLAHGNQDDERRHWTEHEGLRSVARGSEPNLFHRRDLSAVEGHIAPEVRDAILDPGGRVVGVVVNALDEHLDKGGQLRLAEGLQGIRPLSPLLDAAMEAGRTVVLVSDHGHVLEAGSKVELHAGAGERWRPNHPPASEGEVEIQGPRVLLDEGSIVVPTTERVRYMSAEKRGYHGGATPQEMLCPLLVITPPGRELADWEPWESLPPSWWRAEGERPHQETAVEDEPVEAPQPAPKPSVDPDGQWQLFGDDKPSEPEVAAPGQPSWLAALLKSPMLQTQREAAGRQALNDEDVARLLQVLDAAGGVRPLDAVARDLGLSRIRVRSKLAALQRMLNVDGYDVVHLQADGTVRFDRDRLTVQFGLDR